MFVKLAAIPSFLTGAYVGLHYTGSDLIAGIVVALFCSFLYTCIGACIDDLIRKQRA